MGDSGNKNVTAPHQGGSLQRRLAMKYVAELNEDPSGDSGDSRSLWMKIGKVLKVVVEVVSFIAAIKTILS